VARTQSLARMRVARQLRRPSTCERSEVYTHRALLWPHVFSPITMTFFLPRLSSETRAPAAAPEGDTNRKGISVERTFTAISTQVTWRWLVE
jgi:hypothetical protein